MIQRKSVVDQIEVISTGGIAVRIALQVVEGEEVLISKFHRTFIAPEDSVAKVFTDLNAGLVLGNEEPIGQLDIDRVAKIQLAAK